mmetsp:Transcript_47132/g.111092  ORF Transcript_47132/g.111092 Transcript_47132/m.111092 type:complete len:370 (+) Transcript_47132:1929-3038(+)
MAEAVGPEHCEADELEDHRGALRPHVRVEPLHVFHARRRQDCTKEKLGPRFRRLPCRPAQDKLGALAPSLSPAGARVDVVGGAHDEREGAADGERVLLSDLVELGAEQLDARHRGVQLRGGRCRVCRGEVLADLLVREAGERRVRLVVGGAGEGGDVLTHPREHGLGDGGARGVMAADVEGQPRLHGLQRAVQPRRLGHKLCDGCERARAQYRDRCVIRGDRVRDVLGPPRRILRELPAALVQREFVGRREAREGVHEAGHEVLVQAFDGCDLGLLPHAAADELNGRKSFDVEARGEAVARVDVGAQELGAGGVEGEAAEERRKRAARAAPLRVEVDDEEASLVPRHQLLQVDFVLEVDGRLARDLGRK